MVEVEEQTFASEAEPITPRFIFPKQPETTVYCQIQLGGIPQPSIRYCTGPKKT